AGGGVVVVAAAADGRIAVPDDLDVAVERAAGVDGAARVDRRRHLELGMEEVDRRGGGEELHVRGRRERQMRIALGHDAAAVDLDDLDAGVGDARDVAVDERVEALLQRRTSGAVERRGGSGTLPARLAPPFRRIGLWNEEKGED